MAWCSPSTIPSHTATSTPSLFFSSKEKFKELLPWDKGENQLVPVQVPEDFDNLDYIPENY